MDSDDANLRISDADRAHVSQLLERAVGQGMLTLDEFSERIGSVLAARTRGDLRTVLADLPDMDVPPAVMAGPADGELLRGRMSSISRRGQWTVQSHIRLNTRMCDTRLDFTSATLQSRTVVLDIDDYFSSTDLALPDGATADLTGVETTAGSIAVNVPHGPRSERLHLVVRGRVRFGTVTARYPFGRVFRRTRLATILPGRCGDFGNHTVRALRQVEPGEAQHFPAEQRNRVLPFAVNLEYLAVGVERPAVHLDGDLPTDECEVHLVAADGMVRRPTCESGVAKHPYEYSLGFRARSVLCGPQQAARGGRTMSAFVAQVRPPELRELDVPLQGSVRQLRSPAASDRGFDDRILGRKLRASARS